MNVEKTYFRPYNPKAHMENKKTPRVIITPAGYEYEEIDFSGKPRLDVEMTIPDIEACILDAIECESTFEPLTTPTHHGLAGEFIHLLIDAYEDWESSDEAPEWLRLFNSPPLTVINGGLSEPVQTVHIDLSFAEAHAILMEGLANFGIITNKRFAALAGELTQLLVKA